MRREQSSDLRGRQRGQFNKNFNARYQCEQTAGQSTMDEGDDRYMIKQDD
jgi:hypothetical protein